MIRVGAGALQRHARTRAWFSSDAKLSSFCSKNHELLKPVFDKHGMTLAHLRGYNRAELKSFVKEEGGPSGLVPSFLEQEGPNGRLLREFLGNGTDPSRGGASEWLLDQVGAISAGAEAKAKISVIVLALILVLLVVSDLHDRWIDWHAKLAREERKKMSMKD